MNLTALSRRGPAVITVLIIAFISLLCVGSGELLHHEPPGGDKPNFALAHGLAHWDAGWYAEIIQNGYWLRAGEQSPVAFFPAYPLTARLLNVVIGNRWLSAELLTLVCGIAGLLLFRRWAMSLAPTAAPWAFLALALYPFSIYLYGIVYSDAMYLLCGVGAFLALEKDRPLLAALLGAVGTACRPIAPALVLGLLVRSLERKRSRGERLTWLDFTPALAGLGFAAYMLYLGLEFGDPIAFAHVQSAAGWNNVPGYQTWLKFEWFRIMFPRVAPIVAIRLGGHAFVTLAALALIRPTFKKLGWGYGVYVLLGVGIPAISSHDFQGLGRYLIATFPLFLTLAMLVEQRPRLQRALLLISAPIFVACAVGFGAGGYVA